MRVIAGSARRLNLKSLPGEVTRPTLDRYKETLFNTMQNYVPGSLFLDLFAGSGSIGIEALSRGARQCYFIENNRNAVKVINENLEFTHLSDKGVVITADCMTGLFQIEKKGPFDVIFMDPPYDRDLEVQVIGYLKDSRLADENTLIVAEASNDTDFSFINELGFMLVKTKEYKTNKHVFIKRSQDGFI